MAFSFELKLAISPERYGAISARPEQPGKWDSGIYLFLLAEEGVSDPERSPGGNLCRGANHGAFPALRAYRSRYGGERCADPSL